MTPNRQPGHADPSGRLPSGQLPSGQLPSDQVPWAQASLGRWAVSAAPAVGSRRATVGYGLLLAVLAPFLAETVASSNTPAFLFPVVLVVFVFVYGLPALLVRELWVRGRLSVPRLLLVGLGYTAFNEGLVAATWFKLAPKDSKVLGFTADQVGRAGGVNWSVAVNLVVFHTVYSIVVPILVIQAVAGVRRSPLAMRPWLGRWAVTASLVALAFVVLGSLTPKATHEACNGPAYAACRTGRQFSAAAVVLIAVVLALLPVVKRTARPADGLRRAWPVAVAGAVFGLVFFVGYFALPLNGLPVASVSCGALLFAVTGIVCRRIMAPHAADRRLPVIACLGLLSVGMLTSLRAWPVGQPVCAALALWLLLWILREQRGLPELGGDSGERSGRG